MAWQILQPLHKLAVDSFLYWNIPDRMNRRIYARMSALITYPLSSFVIFSTRFSFVFIGSVSNTVSENVVIIPDYGLTHRSWLTSSVDSLPLLWDGMKTNRFTVGLQTQQILTWLPPLGFLLLMHLHVILSQSKIWLFLTLWLMDWSIIWRYKVFRSS